MLEIVQQVMKYLDVENEQSDTQLVFQLAPLKKIKKYIEIEGSKEIS